VRRERQRLAASWAWCLGAAAVLAAGPGRAAIEAAPPSGRPDPGAILKAALDGPLAGCDEIVFAQRVSGRDHWYGNFGHYCENDSPYSNGALIKQGDMRYAFGDGGRLCRLNLRTGKLRVLLDDPAGGVRDPDVHYDGRKILFSYRRGGTTTYHLYEIDADGTNLRQLTDGPDNDIEPIYTPDGGIVFCSSRCHRFVPCWRTQVAVLYRCDADGRNVRMLSNNSEQENTPWMLPDGRVLYMRWEYVDRHMMLYHHLWTVNPDGTGVMVYFGNQHPGLVMIDAKPIPGTGLVVASFSPGHGMTEHAGVITIVDPRRGPDDMSMARKISPRTFRDPYPLSADYFFVADKAGLHLLTAQGQVETVYQPHQPGGRWDCHEPRPLRARPREPVIPSRFAAEQPAGRLVLSDVYAGRNMAGVRPGEIKKLLVLEQLPRPGNFSNGQEPLTVGGTFLIERILGTVPVEPDGSASFEAPALKSLFFVALDENDRSVKRMQSFVTLQPGETTSCVGCHEPRVQAPHARPAATLAALRREPSRLVPFEGIPDVLDFPRDIQPILDRHCVRCHNADRRDGQVELSGDRTPYFTTAYWTMFSHGLVVDGRNSEGNRPPRAIGSSASRLMTLIDGSHHEATLSAREQTLVRLWIESGAVYPGTYGALGSGIHTVSFPEATVRRRCASCHQATERPYRNYKQGAFYYQFGKRGPPQPLLSDIYDIILIRHLAYFQLGEAPLYQALCNLDRPEKSMFLRAPLARQAGGLGLCGRKPVFEDQADPDYREILAAIEEAAQRLARQKRFDMPGFRPNRYYIREMQHFGILPKDLADNAPVDPYATDRAYWATFQYAAPEGR
jgi:cytochrome c553